MAKPLHVHAVLYQMMSAAYKVKQVERNNQVLEDSLGTHHRHHPKSNT